MAKLEMKLAKFALVKSTRGMCFNAYTLKGANCTLDVAGDMIEATGRSQQITARVTLIGECLHNRRLATVKPFLRTDNRLSMISIRVC